MYSGDCYLPHPTSLRCLPSGDLILATTHRSIYLFHPPTREMELLAGPEMRSFSLDEPIDGSGGEARFNVPAHLAIAEHTRCAYLTDYDSVRCLTLPDHLF